MAKTQEIIRLRTHQQRSKFVAREMRRLSITEHELAEQTGLHWTTITRFAGVVPPSLEPSRDPRTSTTVRIFFALGWNIVFERQEGARGTVIL